MIGACALRRITALCIIACAFVVIPGAVPAAAVEDAEQVANGDLETERTPLWMRDLNQEKRFMQAVKQQRDLGESLGVKNSHSAAAEKAQVTAMAMKRAQAKQKAKRAQQERQRDRGGLPPRPEQGEAQRVMKKKKATPKANASPKRVASKIKKSAPSKKVEALKKKAAAPKPNAAQRAAAKLTAEDKQTQKAIAKQRQDKVNKGNFQQTSMKKPANKDKPPPSAKAVAKAKKAAKLKKAKTAAKPKPKVAKGDKPRYPSPPKKPQPRKRRPLPKVPTIPEGFLEPQIAKVPGTKIKPNINTFMYYDRMISLYLLPTESFQTRKYLMMGNEEKLLLRKIAQDQDRKFMSFRIHRALAYTGQEAYGQKPFCYSLQLAHDPTKWLMVVRNVFFTARRVPPGASLKLRRAASFCVINKKAGKEQKYAVSLTTWDDVDMVWRAVGKFVSLGKYVKKRRKDFTPKSATFVVSPAVFHGMCHNGVKKKCQCDAKYYGRDCHAVDCVGEKEQKKPICNSKGVCQKKYKQCSCANGWFGHDCQHKRCPTWGPVHALRTCNHRGSCNTKTGACRCDEGWLGESCQKGGCPTATGTPCSGHGKCDTATGICSCGPNYWGRACERKKCAVFYPTCGSFGTCVKSGKYEGHCKCKPGGSGNACQYRTCPIKDCSGHGFCDINTGQCNCFKDWFGAGCTDRNCPNGCSGHGKCQWTTGFCKCASGWGLADCSERTCPGTTVKNTNVVVPCSGKGRCDPTNGKCTCYGHTWGSGCEKECPGKCSENGKCNPQTGKCECSGLYFGKKCQFKACPNNCHGQGRCDLPRGSAAAPRVLWAPTAG